MNAPNHVSDEMVFFSELMRHGSLAATARELGVTPPAISKRLAQLETRLGVILLNRTTRRISLTPEGEVYLASARRILAEIDEVEQQLRQSVAEPHGLLRVNATLGFGRNHIAPIVSRFCKLYSNVQVQLQLTVDPAPLNADVFDVCVRFGEPPDASIVARRIASNRRLLCAAPDYLHRRGIPRTPRDLIAHDCISIRHGGDAYGVWRLSNGKREEVVKVGGAVMTNDGDVAVQWALDGHGILMRAEWDIVHHLRDGRLVPVLEGFRTPSADIYAVYPPRHQLSGRVRIFVDFLSAELGKITL